MSSQPSHATSKGQSKWLLVALGTTLLPGGWLAYQRAKAPPTPAEWAAAFRSKRSDSQTSTAVAFRDVTEDLGIVSLHDNDARGKFFIPEEMGPGVGVFDFDNDGDLDILVAGGGSLLGDGPPQAAQLWRNEGDHFSEVATEVGADVIGPTYGVTCGDIDNDGDIDVYLTRLGSDRLLINEGGRFVDQTEAAGIDQPAWGTSAVLFDYDRDGLLDLYVANYLDWTPETDHSCYMSGIPDYCDPTTYDAPAQDRLYRNIDGLRFEDVTRIAGIEGHRGNGLGVCAADFNGDGWLDLYVANDATPAMLWINRGDGTFEDRALAMGCAYNGHGVAISGMGIACEDLDGNGHPDLLVTNIHSQMHLMLSNQGSHFVDQSMRVGLAEWSTPRTGFGAVLFDQDHDGQFDLFVTNGGVNLTPERAKQSDPYAEPDQFVRFDGKRFREQSQAIRGAAMGAGRALASGDLDGDGDLDLVVTNNGGNLQVLRNENSNDGHWLLVDVRTKSGAPALNAQVTLRTERGEFTRTVRAHSSYLSSSDPRVHFGLGDLDRVEAIQVRWLDGTERVLPNVAGNQVLVVEYE